MEGETQEDPPKKLSPLEEVMRVAELAADRFTRLRHYILDENNQVIPVDLLTWARWFESTTKDGGRGRIVARDTVGDYWVSTVFLGLDHNFGSGPPLLFETMVFVSEEASAKSRGEEGYQDRYTTWGEALRGHNEVVERLKESG